MIDKISSLCVEGNSAIETLQICYCYTLHVLGHDTIIGDGLQNSVKKLNKLCQSTPTVPEENDDDKVTKLYCFIAFP